SRAHAADDRSAYNSLLDWGLRLVLLLGIPAALGLALLSDGLVATLSHYGAFGAADMGQTRLAVMAYSVGLIGLLAIKILAPAFYARQDIRTPVKIAAVSLVATQLSNIVLVPWLAHAGLALSIGLGATLNAGLLVVPLYRRGIYQPTKSWGAFLLRCLPAQFAIAAVLVVASNRLDWVALGAAPAMRAAWLAGLLATVGAVYFSTLWLFGFRPADFTRRSK